MFDLLHLNGDGPLSERRALLAELVGDASPFGAVHVSEHFGGDGTTLAPPAGDALV
jgi:ATP-dependent DNA ligase